MPNVTLEIQKGNFAETIASAWLSRKCLVRPVAAGTDIGIDLYCESLVGTSPFQHFWVQVKTISQANLENGGAFFDFKTDHLRYWSNQPVPVYAFLVPIFIWPPPGVSAIWGVRLTDRIIRLGIPDQESVRYHTTDSFEAATLDADLNKFVSIIVPFDTALLYLPKGLVAPIAKVEEAPLERFPSDVALRCMHRILQSIKFATELTMAEIVTEEARTHTRIPQRATFHAIGQVFKDSLTALGLSAMANSAHLDGDIPTAIAYLQRARDWITQSDMDPGQKAGALAKANGMLRTLGAT